MTSEILHGHQVDDPFRDLEDPASDRTTEWNAEQDARFAAARELWPQRSALRLRLAELSAIGFQGAPYFYGERSFSLRRSAGQDHAVLVVTEASGEQRTLIDPAAIDPSGMTTLDVWYPSPDGALLGYGLSAGGTEWAELRVLDVSTGAVVDGPIDRTRHPSVAWLPDGREFFYVRFLSTDDLFQRVYRHRLGDDPGDDVEVFGAGLPRATYLSVATSDDGRRMTVTASRGTDARNDVWVSEPATGVFTPVLVGADALTYPSFDRSGQLWVLTNHEAPRRRLCRVGDTWQEVIAEDPEAVLEDFEVVGDRIVVVRSRHAVSEVAVHDAGSGDLQRSLDLPGLGTVTELTSRRGSTAVWLSYTDYLTPSSVIEADVVTGSPAFAATSTTRQITFASYDGTAVRMFLIEPPGASGPRPTILYGYGGFNIALTPAHSTRIRAWVDAGGAYAVANLRGGSEEGEAWHRAGMREHKTNVFDDFAAASDWLVDHGVTTREQLGIFGGSNGGLLVGAAITRHPDKWSAAICSAPLLDMVRYEQFGLGELWNGEYGTAADPHEFEWLLSYSPYHNVHSGVDYPATLFSVFEGDTRVDPLHARKMCALLQSATGGDRPILIRRETGVGHSSRAVSRDVELAADELGFLSARLRRETDSIG